jgi:hypothetical protein
MMLQQTQPCDSFTILLLQGCCVSSKLTYKGTAHAATVHVLSVAANQLSARPCQQSSSGACPERTNTDTSHASSTLQQSGYCLRVSDPLLPSSGEYW